MSDAAPLELVPLATAHMTMAPGGLVLPDTPSGTLVIAEVTDFRFEGERLRGRMKGRASADWMHLSNAALGTLDVRALMETDDGALVFMSYRGRLDLSGGPGASPVYAAPLFDTGDERYAWLTRIQAVGRGVLSEDLTTLTYDIYELR